MRSCAIASTIGGLAFSVVLAMGACHTPAPLDIPPVTSAPANTAVQITTEGLGAAPASAVTVDASATPQAGVEPPAKAQFRDLPGRVDDGVCTTTMIAVASGVANVANETLAHGDVIVLAHATAGDLKGTGLVLEVRLPIKDCSTLSRPPQQKTVVRANAASKLEWAGGKMSARLDVGTKLSPDLYLGRLEGTAAVAEHVHAGSWEIFATIEAAGTFTLDGKDQRLGARQVVLVPPNTKHAWKPDPGSKLVGLQMYSPPGPEQRFIALAAAEKDAGKP